MAVRIQIVVSEMKRLSVSHEVTKVLEEPVALKHMLYKITIILKVTL